MRETKRYAFKVNEENDFDLIEHSNGEFVRYEDYARLKAEVERLTQLNDTIALRYDATKSMLDGCAKEIEEMEAEVARLTKAGDAIYQSFDQFGQVDATTLKGWQAAKGVKS